MGKWKSLVVPSNQIQCWQLHRVKKGASLSHQPVKEVFLWSDQQLVNITPISHNTTHKTHFSVFQYHLCLRFSSNPTLPWFFFLVQDFMAQLTLFMVNLLHTLLEVIVIQSMMSHHDRDAHYCTDCWRNTVACLLFRTYFRRLVGFLLCFCSIKFSESRAAVVFKHKPLTNINLSP